MTPEPTRADVARELLLYKMREYSQDGFCASWLHDMESELWQLAVCPSPAKTAGFAPNFFREIHGLALIAGGWWVWKTAPDPEKSGPVFISLSEWDARRQRQ